MSAADHGEPQGHRLRAVPGVVERDDVRDVTAGGEGGPAGPSAERDGIRAEGAAPDEREHGTARVQGCFSPGRGVTQRRPLRRPTASRVITIVVRALSDSENTKRVPRGAFTWRRLGCAPAMIAVRAPATAKRAWVSRAPEIRGGVVSGFGPPLVPAPVLPPPLPPAVAPVPPSLKPTAQPAPTPRRNTWKKSGP